MFASTIVLYNNAYQERLRERPFEVLATLLLSTMQYMTENREVKFPDQG